MDGIAINAKDVPNAGNSVTIWLSKIGVSAATKKERTIKISIGGVELEGVLYNTDLASKIAAQFPLTISMVLYGGREYYDGVDFYPKNSEGGQKHFENGDITYCEAHHNRAIFFAQTNNIKFGLSSTQIKNYSKISIASFR